MKKRKRICSLFLACMITVGSWIPGEAVTALAEEPVSQKEAAENTVSDEGDFEKEYIQMHLEYIDSEEYIGEVSAVKGGLSQCLARTYEEAKLNEVNNSWDMASAVIDYLAKSEVDPSLLNTKYGGKEGNRAGVGLQGESEPEQAVDLQ